MCTDVVCNLTTIEAWTIENCLLIGISAWFGMCVCYLHKKIAGFTCGLLMSTVNVWIEQIVIILLPSFLQYEDMEDSLEWIETEIDDEESENMDAYNIFVNVMNCKLHFEVQVDKSSHCSCAPSSLCTLVEILFVTLPLETLLGLSLTLSNIHGKESW